VPATTTIADPFHPHASIGATETESEAEAKDSDPLLLQLLLQMAQEHLHPHPVFTEEEGGLHRETPSPLDSMATNLLRVVVEEEEDEEELKVPHFAPHVIEKPSLPPETLIFHKRICRRLPCKRLLHP